MGEEKGVGISPGGSVLLPSTSTPTPTLTIVSLPRRHTFSPIPCGFPYTVFIYASKQASNLRLSYSFLFLSLLLRPGPQFLHYALAECVIGMIWHRLGRASRRADVTIWRVMNWRLKALFSQCVSYPCVYFWFTFGSPCLGYGRAGAAISGWDCGMTIYGKRGCFEIEARLVPCVSLMCLVLRRRVFMTGSYFPHITAQLAVKHPYPFQFPSIFTFTS
jgi:hypothetical protein